MCFDILYLYSDKIPFAKSDLSLQIVWDQLKLHVSEIKLFTTTESERIKTAQAKLFSLPTILTLIKSKGLAHFLYQCS